MKADDDIEVLSPEDLRRLLSRARVAAGVALALLSGWFLFAAQAGHVGTTIALGLTILAVYDAFAGVGVALRSEHTATRMLSDTLTRLQDRPAPTPQAQTPPPNASLLS